jgi:hypothetical protein
MNWNVKIKNIKSTLAGIVGFLLSIPIFVQALDNLANHQKVDWVQVAIGGSLWAFAHGLLNTKDDNVHSTVAEVSKASVDAQPK